MINENEAPSRAKKLLETNDILYQTVRPYQKNNLFFIPNKHDYKYVASTGYAQIQTTINNSQYVYQYLYTNQFVNKVLLRCTGTSYPAINSTDLAKIKISIPTLKEQTKIANFLTSVDEKIDNISKELALFKDYKKGIMQRIFSQEIRFEDDGGGGFPDWVEKKLGDFKELEHGDGDWILSRDITDNGNYKIVQLGNIGFGKYIDKPLKKISTDAFLSLHGTPIKIGDLLINRMVDGNINSCIFNFIGDFITSVDVCWIRQSQHFDNYFLMNLLTTENIQKKLLSLSSGSGRIRISKKNLFWRFYFPLPSIDEQTKIANFLSSIDDKIDNLAASLKHWKLFKKSLLQKMFV